MQKPGPVQYRELLGRTRERVEGALPAALDQRVQALALDQLAQHERPPTARQPPEAHDPGYPESLQTGERDGFAHQRRHLPLARLFGQHLERQASVGVPIPDHPDFPAAAFAEFRQRLVACR